MKLKNKSITPPGGFRYVEPDKNYPFVAPNFDALVDKVRKWDRINDIDVPADLPELIETWICERVPDGICNNKKSFMTNGHRRNMVAENIINETVNAYKSSKHYSREDAESHAKICANCKANVRTAICASCKGVNSIVRNILGKNKTAYDSQLHYCSYSGIMTRVVVWCKGSAKSGKADSKPSKCWI